MQETRIDHYPCAGPKPKIEMANGAAKSEKRKPKTEAPPLHALLALGFIDNLGETLR